MNDFVNIVGKITQYKDEPAVSKIKLLSKVKQPERKIKYDLSAFK